MGRLQGTLTSDFDPSGDSVEVHGVTGTEEQARDKELRPDAPRGTSGPGTGGDSRTLGKNIVVTVSQLMQLRHSRVD